MSGYTSKDAEDVTADFSPSRRGFLKIAALSGAAVSISGQLAYAAGERGFWAKDLADEQLIDM